MNAASMHSTTCAVNATGFCTCGAERPAASKRAFILMRLDEPGGHEGVPVAVYVDEPEAAKADIEHRRSVNPNSHYYWIDKPLNPKADS